MPVKTGAQAWYANGFAQLQGMRIGFVANQTATIDEGLSTLEALIAAPDIRVETLFGPEHGAFGSFDENVPDLVEPSTNLPIRSLYGTSRKPAPDDLTGLDALLFEMQDIGARFYTYASTLGLCLEACSERGIPLIVLDRPNPITGMHFEGPLADPERLSFTAYHTIPIRHGLTLGELAKLYAIEKHCEHALRVAACTGYTRQMWFDETGLPWRNPSPAMRNLEAATLYPGVCLLEQTNFSVGRGTDAPFQVAGAPYVKSEPWIAALERERLPGVQFEPCRFTPALREFAGEQCNGIRMAVTARDELDAVRLGVTLITTLRDVFPEKFDPSGAIKLLANQKTFDAIAGGRDAKAVCATWRDDLAAWESRRKPALLY
ncbi:MAG: DUF1343 domain-containing protein [Capsulimonadaceae bacterium]|nr:DUF1343 domain-containing protein [Capsulimonadaceae bacterium]